MSVAGVLAAIEAASAIITAVNTLAENADPLLDRIDIKPLGNGADDSAGKDDDGAGSKEGAGVASGALKNAAGHIGGAFHKMGSAAGGLLRRSSDEEDGELLGAVANARRSVLDSAAASSSVEDLVRKAQATAEGTSFIDSITPFDFPGCFVIATYGKKNPSKDLAGYTYVFVGKSESVAHGVLGAISRTGDPDLYADVKYEQNVQVFIYSCVPDNIDTLYEQLNQVFASDID